MRWGRLLAVAGGAHLTLLYLGQTWGSTREERRRALPGDWVVPDDEGSRRESRVVRGSRSGDSRFRGAARGNSPG